jgi:hypothetical protein
LSESQGPARPRRSSAGGRNRGFRAALALGDEAEVISPMARRLGAGIRRWTGAAGLLSGLAAVAFLTLLFASTAAAAPPAEFGSNGEAAGQFSGPRGIAVDQQSGDIYIGDRNNQRVDKFGPDGEFLLAWGWGVVDGSPALQVCTTTCRAGLAGSGAGQFSSPEGVAVDNDPASVSRGDVYVLDRGNHRIEKFGTSGEFILTFGGEVDKSTGADLCTAASGELCGEGVPGPGPGQFEGLGARALAVGPGGDVYVGDLERVQRFGLTGVLQAEVPLAGIGVVEELAVDSAGALYVRGSEPGGVHKFSPSGIEEGTPRDALGESSAVIAVDGADELLVFQEGQPPSVLAVSPAGAQIAATPAAEASAGIAIGPEPSSLLSAHEGAVETLTLATPGKPFVVPASTDAVAVGPTAATLQAALNPEGGEETTFSFQYGAGTTYGQSAPIPPAELSAEPFESQTVEAPISGLTPETTYHFRVVATNKAGETTTGPDQTFETLPSVSIISTSASSVTSSSAKLEAELDPHGLLTEYQFEYGPTATYGFLAPPQPTSAGAGSRAVDVGAVLQGLQPGAVYHFRVVAHNALGPVAGPDVAFTTQTAASALLPDGRGWELVSPSEKHGIPLEGLAEEGGDIQAAADGSALSYISIGPIGSEPAGNRSVAYSQLLAHRRAGAWQTEEISTPHQAAAPIFVGHRTEYQLFSSDLQRAVVAPAGATPLSPATSEPSPYLREPGGSFRPLVTACPAEPSPCPPAVAALANVAPGTSFGPSFVIPELLTEGTGVEFVEATEDLRHIVLTAPQDLTSPPFTPGGLPSLYEWNEGSLMLVSQIPPSVDVSCGPQGPDCLPAAEAGLPTKLGDLEILNMRGAVSPGGDRIVFSTKESETGHLYMRQTSNGETVQLDAPAGVAGGTGIPHFQLATADGTKVFFTDTARLTPDSTARTEQPDLYMCEIDRGAGPLACDLSDLSIDPHPGESADVQGKVLGAGDEGRFVYFVANGALVSGATRGSCIGGSSPEALCNLYVYDTAARSTSLIATLSDRDHPSWAGGGQSNLGELTSRVSPDGRYLAFSSRRSLTGYDNRDAVTDEPDEEVFLYHQGEGNGTLLCASCNPTGSRPRGRRFEGGSVPPFPLVDRAQVWGDQGLAASVPGWTRFKLGGARYQSRYLSDSGRLFFNAADPLVPADTNGTEDVYEYEPPAPTPEQAASNDCTTSLPTYSPTAQGCISLISSGKASEESAFLDASESGDDVFFLTTARLSGTDTDSSFDVYDAHVCTQSLPCIGPSQSAPAECSGEACQGSPAAPVESQPVTASSTGSGNARACPKGKVKQKGKCVKRKPKKARKSDKKKHHHVKKDGSGKKSSHHSAKAGAAQGSDRTADRDRRSHR